MIDKPAKCPKCNDIMEEGAPSDMGFGWASLPWGESFLKRFTAKVTRVRGLRCRRCGYLELYTKP